MEIMLFTAKNFKIITITYYFYNFRVFVLSCFRDIIYK